MNRIAIFYFTTDGQTAKICRRLQERLEALGNQVRVACLAEESALDPASSDKIVIGASIRYGKHHRKVYEFIAAHESLLTEKPSAFFSVNLVARKPLKASPDTNPYARRFLRQIPWRPDCAAVFAGRLDYPRYGFLDRQIIRLIMAITGGPTDPKTVVEYTDWDAVDRFADRIAALQTEI